MGTRKQDFNGGYIVASQEIENAKQMIVNLEVAKTMDRKTNTRRLPKKKILDVKMSINKKIVTFESDISNTRMYEDKFIEKYAQYKVGQNYWIREPVQVTRFDDILQQYDYQYVSDGRNVYQADIPEKYKGHNNPRWMKNLNRVPNGCLKTMARTFIKITNVRVERLQDMKIEDFLDEGINDKGFEVIYSSDGLNEHYEYLKCRWIELWNSTAPKGYKWEDNPYVFVYEFERVEDEATKRQTNNNSKPI